jgi:hypothetical protein
LAGGFGDLADSEREAVAHLQERCRGDAAIGEFPEDFWINLNICLKAFLLKLDFSFIQNWILQKMIFQNWIKAVS